MRFSLAILCALEVEAAPILDLLSMVETIKYFDDRLGFRLYGSLKFPKVCLVLFGKCGRSGVDRIGTQIAGIAAWETVRTLNPKILVSAGTAGGFKYRGANIGDVFLSDKFIYFHGRHIPIPKYKIFEIGSFPTLRLPKQIKFKTGVVSSSDSIPASHHDMLIMRQVGTDAKDMEAASIAEVAQMSKTPVFAIKTISDFIDSSQSTHEQFLTNFSLATKNLAEALYCLISTKAIEC